MATIGQGLYAEAVHEFFDGLRNYDAPRAAAVLAEDADFSSPWNEGTLTGREAIQECLEGVVSDAVKRPSFTIQDIAGDGHVVRLKVSISGRFGHAPALHEIAILHLKGTIHQVAIRAL